MIGEDLSLGGEVRHGQLGGLLVTRSDVTSYTVRLGLAAIWCGALVLVGRGTQVAPPVAWRAVGDQK